MTAPTISTLPPAPARTQSQTVFRTNADNFVAAQATLVTETNALGDWMDNQVTTVTAIGSGFVGDWSNQTGAASIPYSVTHNGAIWLLTANVADITAEEPSGSNTNWQSTEAIKPQTVDVTVQVTNDAEYLAALATYSRVDSDWSSNTSTLVTINIATGMTLSTQLLIDNGQDMSHITITSTDATVTVDSSALQTTFNGRKPLFGAANNSTLPVINVLFAMDGVGEENLHDGIYVYSNSRAIVRTGKGVNNCGGYGISADEGSGVMCEDSCSFTSVGLNGIIASNGSYVVAKSVNVSSAGRYGILAIRGSTVEATSTNCVGANNTCVYALTNSIISCDSATLTGSVTGSGAHAQYNSLVHCVGSTITGNAVHGVHASNASSISCDASDCSSSGTYGVYAEEGSTIDAGGSTASSSGSHNVYASAASTINIKNSTVSSSTSGYGIFADGASSINATGATAASNSSGDFLASNSSTIQEDNAGVAEVVTDLANGAVSITGGGYVGIGTSSPERLFHAFDGESGALASNSQSVIVLENSNNAYLTFLTPNTNEGGLLWGDSADNDVAGITYSHNTNAMSFRVNAVNAITIDSSRQATFSGNILPATDNTYTQGNASFRMSELFSANDTINTSDETQKTQITVLTATEKLAYMAVKDLIGSYKWLDAIDEKGDAARIHVGVGAQSAIAEFTNLGLDWTKYSCFCLDDIEVYESQTVRESQQVTVTKTRENTVINIVDGVPTQVTESEEYQEPQFNSVGVVDENGDPVVGSEGRQLMHKIPIMNDVDVEKQVLVPAGQRYGIRYNELIMGILASI